MLPRTSIKDSHLFLNRQKAEVSLTHPSFSISMQEKTIVTTVSLNKEHPVYFKGFFILHRETGERYDFSATEMDHTTFSFTFNLIEFIQNIVASSGKDHFELYMSISYFIDNQWLDKEEPLSLDLFEQFDSFGLTQFEEGTDTIFPYFSRKTNGFCFTVNVPVRSLRYIEDNHLTSIKMKKQFMNIRGTITSKAFAINRVDTIMVGKSSGLTKRIHSAIILDRLETGSHLYHYDYHILIDTKELAKQLLLTDFPDDDFDLYFEVYLNGLFEPTVVRVGQPKKVQTKWFRKNAYYTFARTTYTFAPNFVGQNQSLSIGVTRMEKEVFLYLQEMLFLFWFLRPFYSKRNIWIIGEKPQTANNNGFAFYQYMRENHPEREVYYVIDEASADYQKVAQLGKEAILPFKSKKYIWHLLMARTILTAYDAHFIYPTRSQQLSHFIRGKKIYLQHEMLGLQNHLQTLGHNSPHFETDLFLVSSKNEQRFAMNTLGYPQNHVAITGLASFDTLFNLSNTVSEKQQVLFFPANHETGLHYQTELIDILAQNYLAFLTSTPFQTFLIKNELELVVALPDAFKHYHVHFQEVATELYSQATMNTVDVLKASKLMITDYAAEAFEFSFLNKPVFFYQIETPFHQQQTTDDHLNQTYQNELPGEIATDSSGLLHLLEIAEASNFALSKKNKQKAALLIEYRDTNARKRIFTTVEDFMQKRLKK